MSDLDAFKNRVRDELRARWNEAAVAREALCKSWEAALDRCKTPEEKKRVDAEYQVRVQAHHGAQCAVLAIERNLGMRGSKPEGA